MECCTCAKRPSNENKIGRGLPQAICQPLYCLECLDNWEIRSVDERKVGRMFLDKQNSPSLSSKPRTLVCHDMKGGYHNDSYVDGCCCDGSPEYLFYHWAYVDIFVYFSHHLVTIPPVGWINAAHGNGVLVLGTFITEFDEGEKICFDLLSSQGRVQEVAFKLALIAQAHHFDGWLLNIENKISKEAVPKLLAFAKALQQQCRLLIGAHSQVIWYDSVTIDGELDWQNELNEKNRDFLDVSDGIFLNYTWKDENLKQTAALAAMLERSPDVYVGLDVFGRGCLGGGGFNTCQAMKEVRRYGLSAAIFAPAWVLEMLPTCDFEQNQYKFWQLLDEFLFCKPIQHLPLESLFCSGVIKIRYRDGSKTTDTTPTKRHYNLSLQDAAPHFLCYSTGRKVSNSDFQYAFSDNTSDLSGSLLLNCREGLNRYRLFCCQFPVRNLSNVSFSVTKDSDVSQCALAILIEASTSCEIERNLVLGDSQLCSAGDIPLNGQRCEEGSIEKWTVNIDCSNLDGVPANTNVKAVELLICNSSISQSTVHLLSIYVC